MKRKTQWNIVETHTITKHKSSDGAKFVNNYELKRTLGQGQFGKVKLCERIPTVAETTPPVQAATIAADVNESLGPPPPQTFLNAAAATAVPKRRQFAMKIFSKKALLKMKEYVSVPQTDCTSAADATTATRMRVVTALDHVHDEIAIMRTLYHRNIVLLFEVLECERSDKIYMVLEFMNQGPCMVFNPETKAFSSPLTGGVLSDAWAKAHLKDILNGLEYLHSRRICHRDLKPGNILLNATGRCHLSDFGCAVAFSNDAGAASASLVSDTVGTYQFLAPECCSGEPYDPFKVDIWSTGVLLYIFLFGKLPFQSESTKELFDEITRCEVIDLPDALRHVEPDCTDLLLRLLKKDPQERITVADALNHPWLAEPDEDEQPLSF